MLAFLQFPVADLRAFADSVGHRLTKPEWPAKTGVGLPQSFVRAFGPATKRRGGADYAWLDEQSFCSAARALRFERLPASDHPLDQNICCAFRRLLFDGVSVARVEIGLAYTPAAVDLRLINDNPDCSVDAGLFDNLDRMLGLPTVVPYTHGKPGKDQSYSARALILRALQLTRLLPQATTKKPGEDRSYSARPLILQALPLARLYAQATTRKPGPNDQSVAYDLVSPGNPLVIFESPPRGFESLPKRFVRVEPTSVGNVDLAFGHIRRYAGDLGIWIMGSGSAGRADRRSARLCLARLHAEQEVLHTVLSQLENGSLTYEKGAAHSEALEKYLNRATRVVNRKSWSGIQQSAICEAFEAAEATETRQKILYLRDKLEGARKQIVRKAEEFERAIQRRNVINLNVEKMVMEKRTINIGAGAIVNAPVIMADSIENSFNALQSSDASDEVKELMGELLKQVAMAGSAFSPEAAKELARDAETLSKEVSSSNPRRKWYEFSLNGLKEAAEAIGDVGKPILETAAKLLPLLLGLFP